MRVKKFKYLGERIETNMLEEEAFTSRLNKMKRAYQVTKETYKKRSILVNPKLMHYNTVTRPEALYPGESLTMAKKGLPEKLEVKERRILRKILGEGRNGI